MKNELLFDPGMNEMVFEHRNKTYGAYQLRAQYDQRMAGGMLISILTIVSLFFGLSQYAKWKAGKMHITESEEIYTVVELDDFIKEIKPRVMVKSAPQAMVASPKMEVIATRVVADESEKDEPKEPDATAVMSPGIGTTDTIFGNSDPASQAGVGIPGPGAGESDPGFDDTPLHMYQVAQKPMFPGGEAAMYKYLREHLQYPLTARENKISGTVVVRFIVNDKGQTENVVIVKSVSSLFNPGSISVIERMPLWTPGKNNGKPVSVVFTLPLTYQLL